MPSYSITGIETVQAVQTPDNRVPLIGGKTTFIRVYVKADTALELTGRLVVQVGGSAVKNIDPLPPAPVVARGSGSRREVWAESLNFRLDGPLVTPGVRKITATIRRKDEDTEPTPPPEHTKTITLWFSPRIDLKVYGVVWAATDGSDFPGTGYEGGGAAPWTDFEGHRRFVENVYPASSYSVVSLPDVGNKPPDPQPFTNLTGARAWAQTQLAKLPEDAIINLLCNWDFGGLQGLEGGRVTEEQNARDSNRIGVVMAQEVAHALGIPWHCHREAGSVTPYPREDGALASADLGVRLTDGKPELVGGVNYPDIMSYVIGKQGSWISSFTYMELQSAITARLPWQPLGGEIDGPVVTTSWGAGRLDVFARFPDGSVRHRYWDQAGFWGPKDGWENLGGKITQRLAAVSWGPNRIDVFGRGLDGALYHKYWNGSVWGPDPAHIDNWGPLGGEIDGPIAATSWGKNRLDVFARFSDGSLRHTHWNGTGWGTDGSGAIWENLGGRIEGHMAAAAPAFDRLDVVARGTDGALHHKYWNGKVWGPDPKNRDRWERLGGEIEGPVAMTSWGKGRLDIFARFKDGTPRHTWSDGKGWGDAGGVWKSLGGKVAEGTWESLDAQVPETLVAVTPGVNRLDVFVQGTDGAVWRKAWNGSHWTPTDVNWQELKGEVDGAMAAVSWGPDRADIFVRGTDGGLWHKSRSGPVWAGAVD